jgi:heme/copper-type cytochrome/quinol oxidase subunit 4
MRLNRNPKRVAALCINVTAFAFYLAALFTLARVPIVFSVLLGAAQWTSVFLLFLAMRDDKRNRISGISTPVVGDSASTLALKF